MTGIKAFWKNALLKYSYQCALLLFLLVWFLIMGMINHSFLSVTNVITVITRLSDVTIIAIGMTVVVIAGGFDLSVGTVMAMVPCIVGLLYGKGIAFGICLLLGFVSALVVGLINGILIAKAGLQPIIGTLATMTAIRSFIYVITEGKPISSFPKNYMQLAHGNILGIPIPILLMVVFAVFFSWIMSHTKFGRFVYATGGNIKAANIAGINTRGITMQVYLISAVLSALAGIVYSSRLISASPDAGSNTAFDCVTAVLLGGTSIVGGKGNIQGTIIGIIILNFIINGFNLVGINAYWQMIFKGCVLLAAIGYDSRSKLGLRMMKQRKPA